MEKLEGPIVDINEIIDAFEMEGYFNGSFVNTKTGKVINLMEDEDFSDVEGEEDWGEFIPDHCLSLPDRDDLDNFGMMEDFCAEIVDKKLQIKLLNSLGGKGSFRRFKDVLHSNDILDDWYRFQHEKFKQIAIEFCKNHKLLYTYTPRQQFQE